MTSVIIGSINKITFLQLAQYLPVNITQLLQLATVNKLYAG